MHAADVAARLNLRHAGAGSWRGDCPACGYHRAFSLREREGRMLWFCASCQDQEALTATIRQAAGGGWTPPAPHAPRQRESFSPAQRTARAAAMWSAAIRLEGTPAEAYLRGRGVLQAWASFPAPEVGPQLRFHPCAPHPDVGGRFPVLLAQVRRATDGEAIAIHRTYLRPDGSGKADLERASLGPVAGGVIMLHALPSSGPLVLAEGIETTLSASALLRAPAWACISAGNLGNLALPASARELIIAGDADAPGRRAARTAARRCEAEGRHVRVALPDTAGTDFNDILRARSGTAEARHG